MVASRPLWILSAWHVASGTEELNFSFYLNVNRVTLSVNHHMCLVAPILDVAVLSIVSTGLENPQVFG